MAKREAEDTGGCKKRHKPCEESTATEQFNHASKSSLLALPAELRNRIWMLSLLEESPIVVKPDLKQPSLLQTCRQIRHEAKPVWYAENDFHIFVEECDDSLVHAWSEHVKNVGVQPKVSMMLMGYVNWNHLKAWCRRIWAGTSLALPKERSSLNECGDDMVAAAHHIAMIHRGSPWYLCGQALRKVEHMVHRSGPYGV